jgi:exodeoxyribonuclease VII large subunit
MHLLPDTAALIERVDRAARDLRNAMRWALQSRRESTARLSRLHEQASPALRIARTRALIERVSVQLRVAISNRVRFEQRAVDLLGSRLAAQAPAARAAAARAAIAVLGPRIDRAVRGRLNAERLSLLNLEKRLRSAGPEETLARGYSIVTTSAGALVRSTHDVRVGDRLSIVVSDGVVGARVEPASDSRQDQRSEGIAPKPSPDRAVETNDTEVTKELQKVSRRKKTGESSA